MMHLLVVALLLAAGAFFAVSPGEVNAAVDAPGETAVYVGGTAVTAVREVTFNPTPHCGGFDLQIWDVAHTLIGAVNILWSNIANPSLIQEKIRALPGRSGSPPLGAIQVLATGAPTGDFEILFDGVDGDVGELTITNNTLEDSRGCPPAGAANVAVTTAVQTHGAPGATRASMRSSDALPLDVRAFHPDTALPTPVQALVTTTRGAFASPTGPKVVVVESLADNQVVTTPVLLVGNADPGVAAVTVREILPGALAVGAVEATITIVGPPQIHFDVEAADGSMRGHADDRAGVSFDGRLCLYARLQDGLGQNLPAGAPVTWEVSGGSTFGNGAISQTTAIGAHTAAAGRCRSDGDHNDDGDLIDPEEANGGGTASVLFVAPPTYPARPELAGTHTVRVSAEGVSAALDIVVNTGKAGAIGIVLLDRDTLQPRLAIEPDHSGLATGPHLIRVQVTVRDTRGNLMGGAPLLTDFAPGLGPTLNGDPAQALQLGSPALALALDATAQTGGDFGSDFLDLRAGPAQTPGVYRASVRSGEAAAAIVVPVVGDLDPALSTLTADRSALVPGEVTTVRFLGRDAQGLPLALGHALRISVSGDTTILRPPAPPTVEDNEGRLVFRVGVGLNVSTVQVTVSDAGGAVTLLLNVGALFAQRTITVRADRTALALGESVLITARVATVNGEPVPSVTLRFSEAPAVAAVGTGALHTTDLNGEARTPFTAGAPGSWRVSATVVNLAGDGAVIETAMSAFVDITVRGPEVAPEPDPERALPTLSLAAGGTLLGWIFGPGRASELFADLSSAWKWEDGHWLGYFPSLPPPLSTDFAVEFADILYLVARRPLELPVPARSS